jgi:acyl dehydratase
MIGAGVEEMCWTNLVRPDDTLRTLAEILETRPLASRPDFGFSRSRTTVFYKRDEVLMKSNVKWLAPVSGIRGPVERSGDCEFFALP